MPRTGLRRADYTGRSLLKQVNGVPTDNGTSKASNEPASTAARETPLSPVFRPPVTEDELLAPPIEYDEEEMDGYYNSGIKNNALSDSDDSQVADIPKSRFTTGKPTSGRQTLRSSARHNNGSSQASTSPTTRRKGADKAESPAKRAKNESSIPSSSQGDELMFSSEQSRAKTRVTYGSKVQSAYGSKTQSTYGSKAQRPPMKKTQSNGDSSPEATFKKPLAVDVPESPTSPALQFKSYSDLNQEVVEDEVTEELGFRMRHIEGLAPPSPEPQFKSSTYLDDDDPWISSSYVTTKEDVGDAHVDALSSFDKSPKVVDLEEESPQTQGAVFRVPSAIKDVISNFAPSETSTTQPISIDDDVDVSLLEEDPTSIPSDTQPQSKCPLCSAPIDSTFLRTYIAANSHYRNRGDLTIRQQTLLCRAHRKDTAQTLYTTARYPPINWPLFPLRLKAHHPLLDSLISGSPSPSRSVLESQVRNGQARTLAQSVMKGGSSLTPGYFGTRGLRVMTEYIVREFAPLLRKMAVEDRLVSARGVTGFVQEVVVPEVAVRLVMEDMGLGGAPDGEEEARRVLRESAAVGELVNEEIEDVVVLRDERGRDG
jgi:hypothetical protein